MPAPILRNVVNEDLSARFQSTATIAASPVDGTETLIATLTLSDFGNLSVGSGIRLQGWAAFTVGTSGVSANLRIRKTNVSGAVVAATGATTATAANLGALDVMGLDAAPGVGAYALTLTIGSGAAASTVSALFLSAVVI